MQMVFVPSRKPMTPMTTARLFEAKPANHHYHPPLGPDEWVEQSKGSSIVIVKVVVEAGRFGTCREN